MLTEKTMSEKTLKQYSNIAHNMGGMKWGGNDTGIEKRKGQKWSKGKSRLGHKGTKNEDTEILQKDLDRLGEWAVVNAMRKNRVKVRQFASRGPDQRIH